MLLNYTLLAEYDFYRVPPDLVYLKKTIFVNFKQMIFTFKKFSLPSLTCLHNQKDLDKRQKTHIFSMFQF